MHQDVVAVCVFALTGRSTPMTLLSALAGGSMVFTTVIVNIPRGSERLLVLRKLHNRYLKKPSKLWDSILQHWARRLTAK